VNRSTEPKPYRCALNRGPRSPLYHVIDTSDGDTLVSTWRNKHLADKAAATSPTFRVREFDLN
jgi:hypothetical protein